MEKYSLDRTDLKKFAYSIFTKLKIKELPVFLCVGSDKFVCDSLAPIVAELLTKKHNVRAYVYGGLDYNVNATNLTQTLNYIGTEHPASQIVLIDATLDEDVGKVIVSGGCYAGMGKVLPVRKMGALSILGVVGTKIKDFNLNSTRLSLVVEMAKFIATGISMAVWLKNSSDKSGENLSHRGSAKIVRNVFV